MKLARKLTVVLVLGVFAVLGAYAWVTVQRVLDLFDVDQQHDARLMGRALGTAVSEAWRTRGEEQALKVVQHANVKDGQLKVRWVWLDAQVGEKHHPMAPLEELEPVALGKDVLTNVEEGGGGYLYTYIPVRVPGPRQGALELSESLARKREFVRATIVNAVIATGVVAAVCGILAMLLGVFFVGRPVGKLVDKARSVGRGDFSRPLVLRSRDELGVLALEMNQMSDALAAASVKLAAETQARIEAHEQLRHADRLMTVGKLASGIAHELGTPLHVVSGRAQMIATGEVAGAEIADNARIIVEQAQRMTKIIRQLLDFARRRGAQKSPTDLATITHQTLGLLAPIADKRSVELSFAEPTAPVIAEVDEVQIQQALTNLVVNGIQAMPKGGKLTVELCRERIKPPADHGGREAEYLCVRVKDQGEGMSRATMEHVFEPFFTTKEVGEGTGLGLPVSYGIVREHEGWIAIESALGAGSTFSIYLPVPAAGSADAARAQEVA